MTRLGSLESAVMEYLWSEDHALSVREVHGGLGRDSLAYTTVMTVLSNLHQKGWLSREMDGRAYRYRPVQTREEHSAQLMSEALEASRDPQATLVHLVDQLTGEQAEALRRILGDDLDLR